MEKLFKIEGLKKYFNTGRNAILKAVDGLTFDIYKGETFGLVGESGCGKSTVGRTILNLYDATAGSVEYRGLNVHKMNRAQAKEFSRKAQMIFQDPYASLNPRLTVGDIIGEGIDIHNIYTHKKRKEKICNLLEIVGLNSEHMSRFPHEFSGGQRQRIGIARALAIKPEFIVCDEPISALDVSVQAQVVNLLMDLQRKHELTYLFIAHDLSIVRHVSDRVCVMYLGHVMELATAGDLYEKPMHPYTKALLSAVPLPDPDSALQKTRELLPGDVPSPLSPPSGCTFHTRCRYAEDICRKKVPIFEEKDKNHFVACHFAGEF